MKKVPEKVLHDMEEAGKQLLSDDELILVNGGDRCGWLTNNECYSVQTHDEPCVIDYCCFMAILHPEDTDEDDACWSDYLCIIVNH